MHGQGELGPPNAGCDRIDEDGSEVLGDSLSLDKDGVVWGELEAGANGFCTARPYGEGFDCSYALPDAENWELEVTVTPNTRRREIGGGIFLSRPAEEGIRCQATASFLATLD